MDRILVFNVNWMGDVIFSSPVFKALKEAYPGAKISCLAVPRVKDVLENIPCVDEVIIYDEKGRHSGLFSKMKLIRRLRKEKFDVAFLLHRSLTRALLAFLAGIPKRVGYDTKRRGVFLTHKIKPLEGVPHRADHYLNVIESFGVKVRGRASILNVREDACRQVERMLKDGGVEDGDFFVVVNPGGNWDLKRWPKESFCLLTERLIRDCDTKVVISGAPKDAALAEEICLHLKVKVKPVILAGKTDINQLMALMKKAGLVISSDSGPLHIANSLGTDVIGIFGPTSEKITGPRGHGRFTVLKKDVGCRRPCYFLKCQDNICMQAVSVEDVLKVVRGR